MTQQAPAGAAPARLTATLMKRTRPAPQVDASLMAAFRMRQAVLEEVTARLG